jgi:hypothetical protein
MRDHSTTTCCRRSRCARRRLRVAEENGTGFDSYRFDSLDYFYGMAALVSIEVAA